MSFSILIFFLFFFFFSSRRRHTRSYGDWSSDVCSSDLMFFNLVEQPFDFPDLFLPARRQLQRQICQSEMDGDQQLAGLIVDRVSDALYLFLECFVELSEGLNGVLESALRHFVRRHALGPKITAYLDELSWGSPVDRILKQFLQDLMVKRDQLQQALGFRNRTTAQLVSSAQHRFASAHCLITQRLRVLVLKLHLLSFFLPRV